MKNLRTVKNVITSILITLAILTAYKIAAFILSGSWSAWGLGQLFSMFVSILRYVFFATILYLIPPVIIYWGLLFMLKNPFVRIMAGIGCTYIFWVIGGGSSLFEWGSLSAPIDSAVKIVRMSAQIYLLVILVMPAELMSILGTIAAVIGSMVIYIFPDAPGTLDDISAVCALISMVFVYLNTLATIIERHSGKITDTLTQIFTKRHYTL